MADRPTLSIRVPSLVARAVISREGDGYRVSAVGPAGEVLPHLSETYTAHKSAYGFAAGLRMTHRCPILDVSAPEVG